MLTREEYIEIKLKAYRTVPQFNSLTTKQKLEFLDSIIPAEGRTDSCSIFVYTLVYPNDIAVIEENRRTKNITAIAKKLNYPVTAVAVKTFEYMKYGLERLIAEGDIDPSLASQDRTTELDELLNSLNTQPEPKNMQKTIENPN